MQLLERWEIPVGTDTRTIELVEGDLATLSGHDGIDILVVSAFPNDYFPSPRSLIGSLVRQRGLSVERLAASKLADLRQDFSCWFSRTVYFGERPAHLLCVESGWRGTPIENADDVFRALALASTVEIEKRVVAMPLIGAGDQGYAVAEVLHAMLGSALGWFRRGIPVHRLKIATLPSASAAARDTFAAFRAAAGTSAEESSSRAFDVFLSYSHEDEPYARAARDRILAVQPDWRVFFDRTTLSPGMSWLMEIAESLDRSRKVVALYTPEYWRSPYCRDEFLAAFIRQKDTGQAVLAPVYLRSAEIPYMFRTVQYAECREADSAKLAGACEALCRRT